jgi:hypothetical protein
MRVKTDLKQEEGQRGEERNHKRGEQEGQKHPSVLVSDLFRLSLCALCVESA